MQQAGPTMRSFEAMGTRFECVLASFDRAVPSTEAAAIAEQIQQLVEEWHTRLSVFEPASTLSRINAEASRSPVPLERDLYDLLDRCQGYCDDTGGRFDIAIGSLMAQHGFRADRSPIAAWGNECVRLDRSARSVWFTRPGVAIDLGAIAKGFVLDLVRDELADHGVTSALVHGGRSSVLGIGDRPDDAPWKVRAWEDDPDAPTIELHDSCLSVSAPSGRTVSGSGHIMDPRSGEPSAAAEVACVCGPSAEICEAWSTALIVDPTLASGLPSGYGGHIRAAGAWSSFVSACACGSREDQLV